MSPLARHGGDARMPSAPGVAMSTLLTLEMDPRASVDWVLDVQRFVVGDDEVLDQGLGAGKQARSRDVGAGPGVHRRRVAPLFEEDDFLARAQHPAGELYVDQAVLLMEERQLLATLRRDHPGPVTLVGVASNPHVAGAIRDELLRARKRWQQPVHLLIDPRLRCYESEVICSEEAWEERCAALTCMHGKAARHIVISRSSKRTVNRAFP